MTEGVSKEKTALIGFADYNPKLPDEATEKEGGLYLKEDVELFINNLWNKINQEQELFKDNELVRNMLYALNRAFFTAVAELRKKVI